MAKTLAEFVKASNATPTVSVSVNKIRKKNVRSIPEGTFEGVPVSYVPGKEPGYVKTSPNYVPGGVITQKQELRDPGLLDKAIESAYGGGTLSEYLAGVSRAKEKTVSALSKETKSVGDFFSNIGGAGAGTIETLFAPITTAFDKLAGGEHIEFNQIGTARPGQVASKLAAAIPELLTNTAYEGLKKSGASDEDAQNWASIITVGALAALGSRGKGRVTGKDLQTALADSTGSVKKISDLPTQQRRSVREALLEIGGKPENQGYLSRIISNPSAENAASVLAEFRASKSKPEAKTLTSIVTERKKNIPKANQPTNANQQPLRNAPTVNEPTTPARKGVSIRNIGSSKGGFINVPNVGKESKKDVVKSEEAVPQIKSKTLSEDDVATKLAESIGYQKPNSDTATADEVAAFKSTETPKVSNPKLETKLAPIRAFRERLVKMKEGKEKRKIEKRAAQEFEKLSPEEKIAIGLGLKNQKPKQIIETPKLKIKGVKEKAEVDASSRITEFESKKSKKLSEIVKARELPQRNRFNELYESYALNEIPPDQMMKIIDSDNILNAVTKQALKDRINYEVTTGTKPVDVLLPSEKPIELPGAKPEDLNKISEDTTPFAPSNNPASVSTSKILARETLPEAEFSRARFQSPTVNRLINLDQFLSAIKMDVAGKKISFSNHIQSLKNLSKQVANSAAETLGLKDPIVQTMNDARIPELVKNVGDDAFIGAKTPEGVEITTKNYTIAKDTYEGISNLDYGAEFSWIKNDKANALMKLGYIWKVNRERPEIINKYIPKDLQEFFSEMDKSHEKVYGNLGGDLTDRGLLGNLADNYERYIMTPERYKALKETHGDVKEFTVQLGDGTIRIFDSFLEMMTFVKNAKRMGYEKDVIPNVESMSSLNQTKAGKEVDLYRTHSDVAQYLDYMREYGNLIRNDEVVKAFEALNKSKDKGVKAYIKNMFSSGWFENPIEQALNIRMGDTGVLGAVEKIADIGSSAVMMYGVDTLLQAATSSAPRAVALTKGNVYTNITPEANAFLREQGFVQTFEGVSVRKALGEKNIATFSGTPIENVAKSQVALDSMSRFLKEKGIETKNDGGEIVSKFKSALDDGTIGKEEYLQWKDSLTEDLNFLGNVSSLARTNVKFLSRFGFGKLKSFNINNVAKTIRDATSLLDFSTSKGKTGSFKGPAKRTLLNVAGFFAAYKLIKEVLDANAEDDGSTDEIRSAIAQRYAEQAYGSPMANVKSFFSGTFSNLAVLPLSVAIDTANAINLMVSQGNTELAAKIGLNEILNDVLQKTQPGQLVDKGTKAATGKSLREIASEKLGVMSREGTTKRVQSTGFGIGSRSEAIASILGYNQDTAVQNFLYSSLNKADLKQEYDMSPAQVATVSFVNDIAKQIQRDATAGIKLASEFGEYNDELMDANYASQAAKVTAGNLTLGDYLGRVGIPESFRRGIDIAQNANIQSMSKSNDQIEKTIGEYFLRNGIVGDTFSERMDDLLNKNPQAYNNFVTGIAKTKRFLDEGGSTEFDDNVKEKIGGFFGKSTTATDAAISKATGRDPLSTSMTQIMQNALFDFADGITKEGGLEDSKRKLKEVENYYRIVMDNSDYTDGIISAAANKSVELKKGVDEMIAAGYEDFATDFPLLKEVMTRGLELRGEFVPKESETTTQLPETKPSVTKEGAASSGIFSKVQATGTLPQKEKKLTLGDLVRRSKTVEKPLFKLPVKTGLTLREILRNTGNR